MLTNLDYLEAEAIYIIREVVAEFKKPVILFSGGKDSLVLVRLAQKAFYPGKIPFPILHIDTGQNFQEVLDFRDQLVEKTGVDLIIRKVEDAIAKGLAAQVSSDKSRNTLQTPTLLAALNEFAFDAALGGARRDEEKARAKERIFSFRDEFGQWDPRNQRPEIWNLYNTRIQNGENIRVYPISNWTELDVWQYIERENLSLPSIYFCHFREVYLRGGNYFANCEFTKLKPNEFIENKQVRFRTVGDIISTGAVESSATTISEIISELKLSRQSERSSRGDDKLSETAMEDRKKEGYF